MTDQERRELAREYAQILESAKTAVTQFQFDTLEYKYDVLCEKVMKDFLETYGEKTGA